MTAVLIILLASALQVLCNNGIRNIQANSRDVYSSVWVNYLVAFLVATAWFVIRPPQVEWGVALAVGTITGLFYVLTIVTFIRSMGQRGMAITTAFANMSLVIVVVVALGFGERLQSMQTAGIVAALIAMPPLSLATVSGKAIGERPSLGIALRLFLLQGLAMSGLLVAGKLIHPSATSAYLMALFGSATLFSLIAKLMLGAPMGPGDIKRGVLFGLPNGMAAAAFVLALAYVPGAVFFTAVDVLGMLLTTLLAVILWKERMQTWGWVGLVLAAAATVFLSPK